MARTKAELDLKPCPFCGNKWLFTESRAVWSELAGIKTQYRIGCCVKQVFWFSTKHEAILVWNRRHSEEATSKKVASSAAKILRSKRSSKAAKSAAASALTQRTR
jgi:hypothetical protein